MMLPPYFHIFPRVCSKLFHLYIYIIVWAVLYFKTMNSQMRCLKRSLKNTWSPTAVGRNLDIPLLSLDPAGRNWVLPNVFMIHRSHRVNIDIIDSYLLFSDFLDSYILSDDMTIYDISDIWSWFSDILSKNNREGRVRVYYVITIYN